MKIKHLLVGLCTLTSVAATNAFAEESFRLKRGAPADSPPIYTPSADPSGDATPTPAPSYQEGRVQADGADSSAGQSGNTSKGRAPLSANVERDAYNAGLDTNQFANQTNQFASQTATSAPLQANADTNERAPLAAGVTKFDLSAKELGQIGRHDIVLIIDRSSSMETMDCPSSGHSAHGFGLGSMLGMGLGLGMGMGGGISRWQWCCEQTTDLARQTSEVLPQGMSVVLFSASTKIFSHVNVSDVPRIFAAYHPGGWTNTGMAVGQTLQDYFQRREASHGNVKPLLVAIITDGMPSDKEELCNVIKGATKLMKSPDEIKITILNVGNDPHGEMYSESLDHRLVFPFGGPPGVCAKYDIVSSVTFAELAHHGLARTMLEVANGQRK